MDNSDVDGERKEEVWVVAGTVLGPGEMEEVGPDKDITVPPMFFKIVIRDGEDVLPVVLAFLLPHHKEPHGEIEDYLVSVDIIEAMTDLDFFRDLDEAAEGFAGGHRHVGKPGYFLARKVDGYGILLKELRTILKLTE